MTARQTLIDGLKAAAIRVDATNTVRNYTDGVAYVLNQPAALTERHTYVVVAAVNVGQDIDTHAAAVLAAINTITGMTALSQTTAYADEPVPGRDMPPADLARIDVASDQLWQ